MSQQRNQSEGPEVGRAQPGLDAGAGALGPGSLQGQPGGVGGEDVELTLLVEQECRRSPDVPEHPQARLTSV